MPLQCANDSVSVEKYLKPEVIRQISRLDLRAQFIVKGFLQGLHASPFQGFSVEFSEHRKYTPGDDPQHIDWMVYAKTDKTQGTRGITAFLVEMAWAGCSAEEIHGKLGLWSSNTAELIFDQARVPAENVMGEVGSGFKVAMSTLDYGRYTVAAGCVGLAQACLDAVRNFVKESGPALLRARPEVRETIGEMARDIDAGRLLVMRVGHLKNRGGRTTRETSVAKYFTSELANRAATQAMRVIGMEANSERYPVERYLRDAKVNTLFEGTSQIQNLIIGNLELGIRAIH